MKLYKKFNWLFLLLMNTMIFGQNFNDVLRLSEPGINSSARSLAMGNAYTALSNDFSGTLFNPAGIALIKSFELSGSMDYNNFDNNSTLFQSQTDYASSVLKLNEFGAVFPLPTKRGSIAFSFGYNIVKNFNSAVKFDGYNSSDHSMIQTLTGPDDISYWLYLTDGTGVNTPIAGQLNQNGNVLESGKLVSWNLSGAMEIAKNIFFGATVDIYSGSFKRDRQFYEVDINNIYDSNVLTDPTDPATADFERFYLNDIIDWDIEGWGAKLGVIYILNDMSTFGFSMKLPTMFKIKENYFVDGYAEFNTGLIAELDPPIDNNVTYEFNSPFEISAGHALTIGPVLFSTDITFIDYTQMEMKKGLSLADVSQINRDINDLFESVVRYNLGVEVKIPDSQIALRGGFMNNPSPFKGDPSEFNKKYITAGFGIALDGPLSLNFAYVKGWWDTYEDNYNDGVNVSRVQQDINVSNLVLSFTYRMF